MTIKHRYKTAFWISGGVYVGLIGYDENAKEYRIRTIADDETTVSESDLKDFVL